MKKISGMNIGELAAFICSYLHNNKIDCVLTGGACVSIYTDNKYQSFDLDFIDKSYTSRKKIKAILSKIGFEEKNRYFFSKETKFIIEFPSGPLSVGSEIINKFNEINFITGKLILLTPIDCIKDRLAAFYHWDDKQALEQAIWVSQKYPIDVNEIQRWSKLEMKQNDFNKIRKSLFTK
jgi:hypothetical protein